MSTPGDERAQAEARNAAMKDRVDSLLEQFERQTAQLREAQATAATLSARLTSKDGLVKATIDATGTLSALEIAPHAFERTTPSALATTVLTLVRSGGLQVKQQVADLMAPITEGLPDLADLVDGAPSLRGLLPEIPTYADPEPEPAPKPESMEDPAAGSIMRNEAVAPPPPPVAPVPPAPVPKPARPARPAPVEDEEPPDTWLTRGD